MAPQAFSFPADWPAPHDPAAAKRTVERFAELGRAERRLVGDPATVALLRCLGGNSPYLADLAIREAQAVRALVANGPDIVVREAMAVLYALPPETGRERVAAALRQAKRIVALAVAIADIGGIWRLDKVTEALSALAEATLSLSVAHLLRSAHDAGDLRLSDPSQPAQHCGFTVLGMGKLGARELNYSSDVDLILIYDPDAGIYTDRTAGDALGRFMVRLSRDLVTLMEARDDCAPIPPRPRRRSRSTRRSRTTKAWARTGNARR